MTPCDNCIHRPICNIWEDYRQLLVDAEPLKKKTQHLKSWPTVSISESIMRRLQEEMRR